jgi:hypothetical protein
MSRLTRFLRSVCAQPADGRLLPLQRPGFPVAVCWSAKSGCTTVLKWFLTQNGLLDEALELINSNLYGNGTAIFTRDGGAARQFTFDVQVGMVGVNVPIPVPVSYYSFGGWKASLFGDNHMYGPDGIQFFTRTKVVTERWPDPSTSKVDLGFPQNR